MCQSASVSRCADWRWRWLLLLAFLAGWIVLISWFPHSESLLLHVGYLWAGLLLASHAYRPRPWRTLATMLWLVAAVGFAAAGLAQERAAIDAAFKEVNELREHRLGGLQSAIGDAPRYENVAVAARALKERSRGWGLAFSFLATRAGHTEVADDYLTAGGISCGTPFNRLFGKPDVLGFARASLAWERGLDQRVNGVFRYLISPNLPASDRAGLDAGSRSSR